VNGKEEEAISCCRFHLCV